MKRAETTLIIDRLAALGEMVRLRILRLLEVEELSVGEVAQVLQLPQSTVSRHLKVLADGEWVARRTEGTATLYRLLPDDLAPDARSLWRTVREQMGAGADLEEDARRLRAVLDERKLDSQTFFGRVSGEWDELRTGLFGSRFTALALLAFLRRDWAVADLGCGTGNASELLSPVVDRVIAVDSSPAMLDAARQRLAGLSNIEFVQSPLESLPIGDAHVDAAVCGLVLHHLEYPADALRSMRRILRPERNGGVALIIDMVKHDRDLYRRTMGHRHLGFTKNEMLGMMHDAGFAWGDYRELPGEPEGRGPGLFVARGQI